MDEVRFDALSRALARGAGRRQMLGAVVPGLLALLSLARADEPVAAKKKKKKKKKPPTVPTSPPQAVAPPASPPPPLATGSCPASSPVRCASGLCCPSDKPQCCPPSDVFKQGTCAAADAKCCPEGGTCLATQKCCPATLSAFFGVCCDQDCCEDDVDCDTGFECNFDGCCVPE